MTRLRCWRPIFNITVEITIPEKNPQRNDSATKILTLAPRLSHKQNVVTNIPVAKIVYTGVHRIKERAEIKIVF